MRDDFAAAQFLTMTDADKLARPSFEPFISGLTVRFDAYEVDELAADEAAIFDYEFIVVDDDEDGSAPVVLTLSPLLATALAAEVRGRAARSSCGHPAVHGACRHRRR